MLALNHSLAGSLAGNYVGNPLIAFLMGIFLHFIFDKLPHFWPKNEKNQLVLLGVDWFLATMYCFWLFSNIGQLGAGPFWGALGGFMVDLILVTAGTAKKNPISNWHTMRQPHMDKTIYFLSDILMLILLTVLWVLK